MKLHYKKINENAKVPTRAYATDAGLDLFATTRTIIKSKQPVPTLVPLGVAIEIPKGYYAQMSSKSGLTSKHGIYSMSGVIDADYRGELHALIANMSDKDFVFEVGDKVCQLIILPIALPKLVEVEELSETKRGEKGWGSSGSK